MYKWKYLNKPLSEYLNIIAAFFSDTIKIYIWLVVVKGSHLLFSHSLDHLFMRASVLLGAGLWWGAEGLGLFLRPSHNGMTCLSSGTSSWYSSALQRGCRAGDEFCLPRMPQTLIWWLPLLCPLLFSSFPGHVCGVSCMQTRGLFGGSPHHHLTNWNAAHKVSPARGPRAKPACLPESSLMCWLSQRLNSTPKG